MLLVKNKIVCRYLEEGIMFLYPKVSWYNTQAVR